LAAGTVITDAASLPHGTYFRASREDPRMQLRDLEVGAAAGVATFE